MGKAKKERLQGTLDMLVLTTLTRGCMHGYGITLHIQQTSDGFLCVDEGSLYPALYRLERASLVESEWAMSKKKRKAKFYRITAAGKKHLAAEEEKWAQTTRAIKKVLRYA